MEAKELTLQNIIDKNVEALWKEFQSIPVDRIGIIKCTREINFTRIRNRIIENYCSSI